MQAEPGLASVVVARWPAPPRGRRPRSDAGGRRSTGPPRPRQKATTSRTLHADIGDRIEANRKEAARLAEYSRRVTGNPWFKRGTLFRAALDALRAAQGPLTVREIADAILAAKSIRDATAKHRAGIEAGVRSSLENHAGRNVERVGEGVPKRWKLVS